jgi:FkbM family methyltransferase
VSNVSRLIENVFDRLGFRITPRWRAFTDPQERYMRRLFALLRPDLIIDVGANAGQYGTFLRKRCEYRGHIVSYEPIPELAQECLRAAIGDDRWRVETRALGAYSGQARFNVMAHDQFSSFLPPAAQQPQAFDAANRIARTISVPVATLDEVLGDLLDRTGAARPYLKLDTQGFDLEVVAGGRSVMDRVVGVQTEIAVTRLYEGAPTFDRTVETLRALGFEPSALFPTNDHFPFLVDMDSYFVRRPSV